MTLNYKYFSFFLFSALVFLDLFTKKLSQNLINGPIELIENIFYLKYVKNTGIAFSIPVPNIVQVFLTIALLMIVVFFWYKEKNLQKSIGLIFIFSGGLGNLYERVFNKFVTDFIAVYKFPIFNLADSFVFIGVCLFLLQELYKYEKK